MKESDLYMLRKGAKSFYEWCKENGKEEYLDLWDYDMNKCSPKDVACTIKDKYYFKCSRNIHESFLYPIRTITLENSSGPKCPVCGSIYQWCLDNNRNDIIEAWDYEKNELDIRIVAKSSAKCAWFTFEYYSYYYPICYITQKNKNNTDPVYKYKNSVGYYIVEKYGGEYLTRFWSDKNEKSPFEYDRQSDKYIWLKCVNKSYHEEYKISCHNFTRGDTTGCPMCSSKKVHPLDSFAQFNINRYGDDWLQKCWMPDNVYDPYTLSVNDNKRKVHIRCIDVDYHDFWITPHNYDRGYKVCHYCNIKGTKGKVHELDSFGAKHPEIIPLWSDKNTKSPFEYSEFSHETVWLKCENGIHEDYKKIISDISKNPDSLCPSCNSISSYEKKTRNYLESLPYSINYEYDCTICPINPLTNYRLPYDNEVVELKLIIEVMGSQHYKVDGFHIMAANKKGTTPEQEFEYQKYKDLYKKQYAIDNGYNYLAIPYYCYDDLTYINMIDIKINDIINLKSVETAGLVDKFSS